MTRQKIIQRLLNDFSQQRPLRGGSLIITVFGDSISMHGNNVWLGSLINALQPFGLNARLIRTAVHRLIHDQWLSAEMVGRRSYYSFTDAGLRRYEKAAGRIYAGYAPRWDGCWTLVLCHGLGDDVRERLRKELSWLGYGSVNTVTLLHPGAENAALHETLRELKVIDQVVVMNAATDVITAQQAMRALAQQAWPLQNLAQGYEQFLQRFRPAMQSLQKAKTLDPEDAFQLRTLLIHEYRRILLRDSDLPIELLPANWVGTKALNLIANMYRLCSAPAEAYLQEKMETAEGAFLKAGASFFKRFGGL